MLKEILNCNQSAGAGYRRWFADAQLELIVWYRDDDKIEGFQLCYPIRRRQYAFTWKIDGTCRHNEIETGSRGPFSNLTPILQYDHDMPGPLVQSMFAERADRLDPTIRETVAQVLKDLNR